ncbi:MAG: hypothetical protein U5L98_06640 [Halomonas sp.]|uniref:hypothetical protein n=1 Tax=Halomonas sp. TaxID=1486246 RepID=UPI002ACDDCAE|nr:hypothetical protein [Halomonas sp.]MDZ7852320.1 hypothetical protein [Halomonas sp.]
MFNRDDWQPVKIPARKVDGVWEFFYGGDIPVRDGAYAEIVVNKNSITDKNFIYNLKKKSFHKFLDEEAEILVALTVKNMQSLDKNDADILISPKNINVDRSERFSNFSFSNETKFIKIVVGGPSKKSKAKNEKSEGGIWLQVEGMEPQGVTASTLILPDGVTDKEVDSLNYAFTLLSNKYEPWRKSHTGNIYDRMFYKEENGVWYPLNVLRNAATVDEENKLIKRQWEAITKQLKINV